MAKKTTLKLWTGTEWQDLFPKTRSDLVVLTDGRNNLEHRLNMVEAVARGAQQSLSFENYEELVEYFKGLDANALSVGQNMYVKELNVPDLWVYAISEYWTNYPFISNESFIADATSDRGIQLGYYILSTLEANSSVIANQTGSQVLVGGVLQDVWNADTKLDKITATTSYPQIYVKAGDGTQTMYNVSTDIVNGAIPRRTTNADILVPNMPISPYGAVNKNYINNNCVPKSTSATTNGSPIVYTNDTTREHYLASNYRDYNAYNIPMIYGNTSGKDAVNGCLLTAIPANDYHAANKKYVDELVASAGGGSGGGIAKLYKHEITLQVYYEASDGETYETTNTITAISTTGTPLTTVEAIQNTQLLCFPSEITIVYDDSDEEYYYLLGIKDKYIITAEGYSFGIVSWRNPFVDKVTEIPIGVSSNLYKHIITMRNTDDEYAVFELILDKATPLTTEEFFELHFEGNGPIIVRATMYDGGFEGIGNGIVWGNGYYYLEQELGEMHLFRITTDTENGGTEDYWFSEIYDDQIFEIPEF